MSLPGSPADPPPVGPPPLPGWAAAVALLSLLGEGALMVDNGLQTANDLLPVSMLLTAVVVVWFSRGVLAGRTVRLVLVLALYGLAAVGYGWVVVAGPDRAWAWVHLLLTLATLGALVALVRSPFHRWQRRHHDLTGVPVGGVLALAAVVGLLGPLAGQDEPRVHLELRVGPEQSHQGPGAVRR